MVRLVLASTSEWRLQLLVEAGIAAEARAPNVDESAVEGKTPIETAQRRAVAKAEAVVGQVLDAWVLGADQVIHFEGETIGKPPNDPVWRAQLQRMRGRRHALSTAVALWDGQRMEVVTETTMVTIRADLSDAEIDAYIASGEARGCAGGYMVERKGAWLVESIEGDWCNVVGLPILRVIGMLRARGIRLPR